jgi:hypothetical protein
MPLLSSYFTHFSFPSAGRGIGTHGIGGESVPRDCCSALCSSCSVAATNGAPASLEGPLLSLKAWAQFPPFRGPALRLLPWDPCEPCSGVHTSPARNLRHSHCPMAFPTGRDTWTGCCKSSRIPLCLHCHGYSVMASSGKSPPCRLLGLSAWAERLCGQDVSSSIFLDDRTFGNSKSPSHHKIWLSRPFPHSALQKSLCTFKARHCPFLFVSFCEMSGPPHIT